MENRNINVNEEANKLETMSASGHGHEALNEFRNLVASDKTMGSAVFHKMQNDARQGQGEFYLDSNKDQLVFSSPFNGAQKIYGDR